MGRDSTGKDRVWVEICLSDTGMGRVQVDSLQVRYGPGCHFRTRADLWCILAICCAIYKYIYDNCYTFTLPILITDAIIAQIAQKPAKRIDSDNLMPAEI